MTTFRIEVIQDASRFAAVRAEWNRLLSSSRADCLFLTWDWIHTWWTQLARSRRLFIVTVRDGSKLIGIAPLVVRRVWIGPVPIATLEFAATGSIGSDYLDFIVDRNHEAAAAGALTEFLAKSGMNLRLPSIREDSVAATLVSACFLDRRWHCRQIQLEPCPVADLSRGSWDDYLGALTRRHRSNFTRSLRNLEKDFSVRLELVVSDEQRQKALQQLVDLHLTRRAAAEDSNAFHNSRLLQFHETFTRLALEREWLRLFILTLDGKPAAALYCFRYGRTFLYYQSGFDPSLKRYGVGQVLVGLTIRRAFEEGAAEYDFLHGAETYKFKWASEVRRLMRLEFYRPSAIGGIQRNAVDAIATAKTVVKQALQRSTPAPLPLD